MKVVKVDTPCPMCRAAGSMSLLTTGVNVPYFGDALETTLHCASCGFRHADFMILSQKDPMRLTYRVAGPEGLRTRVIRSNSGTLRIDALGFLAEPTPLSESFVSNVEGVLTRAREVLLTARSLFADEPEKQKRIEAYLETCDRLMNEGEPFTLVIDDPLGNSAIVDEAVERRPLTEAELAELKTGMILLDKEDVAGFKKS